MVQVSVLRAALARLAESQLELDHALGQIKLAHSRPSGIAATDASMAVGWQKTLIEELGAQCSATSQLCYALLSASDTNSSTRRQREAAPSTLTVEALYAPGTDDDDSGRGKAGGGAAAAAPKVKLPSLSDFVPSDDEEEKAEKAEEAMKQAQEKEEKARARAREQEDERQRQQEAAAKLEADAKAAAEGWDKSAEGEGEGEGKDGKAAAVAVEGGTPAPAQSELGLDENGKRKRPPNLRDATIERMQARLKASLYGTTAKAFFKRYDKDKSGSLSATELKDLVRRVLKVYITSVGKCSEPSVNDGCSS